MFVIVIGCALVFQHTEEDYDCCSFGVNYQQLPTPATVAYPTAIGLELVTLGYVVVWGWVSRTRAASCCIHERVASDAFASNTLTLSGKDKTKTREISGTQTHTAVGIWDSRMIRRHVECVLNTDCFHNLN